MRYLGGCRYGFCIGHWKYGLGHILHIWVLGTLALLGPRSASDWYHQLSLFQARDITYSSILGIWDQDIGSS